MRIVEINTVDYASTGNIMLQIAEVARAKGHTVFTASSGGEEVKKQAQNPNHFYFGTPGERFLHICLTAATGRNGFFSYFGTRALIRKLKEIKPDILHLHNLHGCIINLPLLFRYINREKIRVVWTLHDCWTFTGRCPHFTISGCEKWKTGCGGCNYPAKEYPISIPDVTRWAWKKKKALFTSVESLTVVTPSDWLRDLAKTSFLGKYEVRTIHNGIDLSIFKPTESDFRKNHGLEGKKILLGVSFGWGYAKGLDVFLRMASELDDSHQVVLVGTDEETDRQLPKNVLSIHATHSKEELAQIYSAADVFVNPTREETFPTVNIEALACGTPVVTFRTGGSPEIPDETCGIVVDYNDSDALIQKALEVLKKQPFSADACCRRAAQFEKTEKTKEYLALYEELFAKGEQTK